MSQYRLGDRSEYANFESILMNQIDLPEIEKQIFIAWQGGAGAKKIANDMGLHKSNVQLRIQRVGEAMREYVRGCNKVYKGY